MLNENCALSRHGPPGIFEAPRRVVIGNERAEPLFAASILRPCPANF